MEEESLLNMKAIRTDDFNAAVDVMAASFADNPTFRWLIGGKRFNGERLRNLCVYCLESAMLRNGGFISENGNGVALVYESGRKIPFLTALRLQLFLIHNCIGWHRVLRALRRQVLCGRIRSREKSFYFLALGVAKGRTGTETAAELKNGVFELSRLHRLPIFAETTIAKNRAVYERYGFETYASCILPGGDFTVWFMKRPPGPAIVKKRGELSFS
jgi:hypothetical protein